jgi:WD40 repeat protein
LENSSLIQVAVLAGHDAPVASVCVSDDFSILVSGSLDHTCILWDLNRLSFIRSMSTGGPVQHVAISSSNGDIAAVSTTETNRKSSSVLSLFNVNGRLLASAPCSEVVQCILFTNGIEGVSRNLLVAGTQSGKLLLFDALDLTLLVSKNGTSTAPITCLTIDQECMFLVSGSADGAVQQWMCGSAGDFKVSNLGI